MFISVKHLNRDMGVSPEVARFFVDRKVPDDNIFWKGRLLYINRGNGYISIPVYYDLLHRIGLPLNMILEESHIRFMEKVMHFAMLCEYNKISFADQLDQIEQLLEGRITNRLFHDRLLGYLRQPVPAPLHGLGLELPSLNRADVFLYVLCDLPLSPAQTEHAIRLWYALHPTYLLMDDIHDYKSDKKAQDENAIIELGDGPVGFARALEIIHGNISTLAEINPVLGSYFTLTLETLADYTN